MEELPQDIKRTWYNITRRLQSVSKSDGLSVITLKVLVSSDGEPVSWEVDSRLLEPKSLQKALLEMVEIEEK